MSKSMLPLTWATTVLESAQDGVLVESREEIVYINRAYAQLLGSAPQDLVGAPVRSIVSPEDRDRLSIFGMRRLQGEPVPRLYAFVAARSDGSPLPLEASVSTSQIAQEIMITTLVRPREYSLPSEQGRLDIDGASLVFRSPEERRLYETLSQREREIIGHLLAGTHLKAIALDLNISTKTVDTHRARAMKKLHLSGHRDLFLFGLRCGLVEN